MRSEKGQKEALKAILGDPLPTIDPIYYAGAKVWEKVDTAPLITPYFLSRLYTVEEMKMVMALPGSAKEVAEKTGMDEEFCAQSLKSLFRRGRILPGKRYRLESADTFTPTLNTTTLRDQIGMVYNATGKDWNEEKELFLLANQWHKVSDEVQEELKPIVRNVMRVIPKYGSIKNLPGVMYSENIREMIRDYASKGELAVQRCVCKAYRNFERYGQATLPDGKGCVSGIVEHDNSEGHCMWFGQRSKYMHEMFNGKVLNVEEAEKMMQEAEEAVLVYSTKNMRLPTEICTCCEDCCPIFEFQQQGYDAYVPSRFRPKVNEAKCIGCKVCLGRCPFKAISYNADGKCVINSDKCMGCGNCVVKCPAKALKMEVVHDTDWIPDVADYL